MRWRPPRLGQPSHLFPLLPFPHTQPPLQLRAQAGTLLKYGMLSSKDKAGASLLQVGDGGGGVGGAGRKGERARGRRALPGPCTFRLLLVLISDGCDAITPPL